MSGSTSSGSHEGPSSGRTQSGSARSTSSRSTAESSRAKAVRHYFKRRTKPASLWPWGLLPLLALLLLFLWGAFKIAPDIEERTRASVASLLNDAGYEGLNVSADGQIIRVSGSADPTEVTRIRSVARGATCDTFVAKGLVCPTSVLVDVGEAEASRLHNFAFVRSADQVVLRGDVPNDAVRASLVASARTAFGSVVDSIVVSNEVATSGFDWASEKAFRFLSAVAIGRVEWQNGVLSASGRTESDLVETIRSTFVDGGFQDRIGNVDLIASEDIAACNDQLSAVLSQSTINFDTGSATISAGSQALLRRLVDVAKTCPGNLNVEGHTDDVGGGVSNRRLSQRRAQAVVDALSGYGIPRSRLTAVGFGEARPVSSNASGAGRARNRRIEVKVADFN